MTGGMTPWMASTASAGVLKSGESESTSGTLGTGSNLLTLPGEYNKNNYIVYGES